MKNYIKEVKRLAEIIKTAKNVLVFSGAGISTESGIPDFRSEEGLWRKIDPQLISVGAMRANPKAFFNNYENFVALGRGKMANKGHVALAKLEIAGIIKAVATQNVDGLHQMAGSKNVIEVHGHVREGACTQCGKLYPYDLISSFLQKNEQPNSLCCGKLLRPTITLFGDRMPDDFERLMRTIGQYDFCLVVGSSLTVSPANSIPLAIGKFAIVNRDATVYDEQAELVIHEGIGDVLESLSEILLH